MIIDFHIHFSPQMADVPAKPRTLYTHGVPSYTEHAGLADEGKLISVLDEAGIDMAVLSSGHGMRGELDGARIANQTYARLMEKYPKRFRFTAHAAPLDGAAGMQEAERWLGVCPGAAIPSSFGEIGLDDTRLDEFYSMLEERNRYLFVHPALAVTEVEAKLYNAYDIYRTVGREFSLVMAAMRLICGGVLDRHPQLKVVMSHLGGGITSLVPRIRDYQNKEMWGIAHDPVHGKTPARLFDEYLSQIYFDTGGFFGDSKAVRAALLHIPKERLLLGTDYPQEIREAGPMGPLIAELKAQGIAGNGMELVESVL